MDLNIEKQNVIVNIDDDNINVKNEDTTMEIVVANDSKDIEVETPEEINIEIGVVNVSNGTNDHDKLINRDKENQHPIGAITGLEEALNNAGNIKDVQVNGKSVVGDDKIANVKVFTKTSELINDSGYISGIPEKYVTDNELNNAIKDKANKTDIPTKVSQLQNDEGFVTSMANNLTNYYLKSETYTKNEVNRLIGNIQNVSITIVDKLPSTGETNVIYFVSKTGSTNDVYDEWVYINNSWEHIGSTEVDLSGYALKTEIPEKTSELTNDSNFVSDANYIHTDNNFTDEDKSKLDDLENFSGNASDVSYIDNLGYDVSNVQEALDKAFDTLDNKVGCVDFTEQVGIISDLETEDTSNIVNAINDVNSKLNDLPTIAPFIPQTKISQLIKDNVKYLKIEWNNNPSFLRYQNLNRAFLYLYKYTKTGRKKWVRDQQEITHFGVKKWVHPANRFTMNINHQCWGIKSFDANHVFAENYSVDDIINDAEYPIANGGYVRTEYKLSVGQTSVLIPLNDIVSPILKVAHIGTDALELPSEGDGLELKLMGVKQEPTYKLLPELTTKQNLIG